MERFDFYFGQKVRHIELDDAFDAVEDAIGTFLQGFGYYGIANGADITENNPTPNFTVDASGPALIYDQLSQKIAWSTTQDIDCTLDENSTATAVTTSGNEKYLTIFAEFERALSDPRTDRNGETVYFSRAESFAINVVQGVEAPSGTAVKPALRSDQVLLADILITYGMTQITNSDIDLNRAEYPYDITGSPLAIKEKGLQDVLQAMLDAFNAIFGAEHTWSAKQTFDGSVPILISPKASPTLASNGDIAYDSTGDDRLIVRINGVNRDIAQAEQSRLAICASSLAQTQGTSWVYQSVTSLNRWRSPSIDGSPYRLVYPFNGLVPKGSTITQISVYVHPDATSTGTDRMLASFYRGSTLIAEEYHDGSSSSQSIVISSLSEVMSANSDYRLVLRAQLATSGSGYNEAESCIITFTDGPFARVP